VDIRAEEVPLPAWTAAADAYILKVLASLGRDDWDLSLVFCGNGYIKTLNARYRNRDEPTDILSFPLGETMEEAGGEPRYLPGDIVISLDALEENARYFAVPRDEELRRLLIHGILHLDGLDHAGNGADQPMLVLQEKILTELSGERILP
jgi:probable rRNA maturation factor